MSTYLKLAEVGDWGHGRDTADHPGDEYCNLDICIARISLFALDRVIEELEWAADLFWREHDVLDDEMRTHLAELRAERDALKPKAVV